MEDCPGRQRAPHRVRLTDPASRLPLWLDGRQRRWRGGRVIAANTRWLCLLQRSTLYPRQAMDTPGGRASGLLIPYVDCAIQTESKIRYLCVGYRYKRSVSDGGRLSDGGLVGCVNSVGLFLDASRRLRDEVVGVDIVIFLKFFEIVSQTVDIVLIICVYVETVARCRCQCISKIYMVLGSIREYSIRTCIEV